MPYFPNLASSGWPSGYLGGAAVLDSTAKYGANCASFPTINDYVTSLANCPQIQPGTSDFCWEAWIKPLSSCTGTEQALFSYGVNSTAGFVVMASCNEVRFRTEGQTDLVYTATVPSASYSHVAAVRQGSNKKVYFNGNLVATAATTANINGTFPFYLGACNPFGTAFRYRGLVDDMRLTVGDPRYTGNFTPPSACPADSSDPLWAYVRMLFSFNSLSDIGLVVAGSPITQVVAAPVTTQAVKSLPFRAITPVFGGSGVISGVTKIGTLAVKRKVHCFDSATMSLLSSKWSGDDGSYSFDGLDKGRRYTVLAADHLDVYNAVVADKVYPL
jgi:hypothetical protein